jgi:hypothetical protein
MIRPTVLTDDGVVGTWKLRRARDGTVEVEVEPFGRPGSGMPDDLDREIRALTRFLGS